MACTWSLKISPLENMKVKVGIESGSGLGPEEVGDRSGGGGDRGGEGTGDTSPGLQTFSEIIMDL